MRVIYFSRDYTPHDYRFLTSLVQSGHEIYYLRLERGPLQLEDRPLPPPVEQLTWAGGRGVVEIRDGVRLLSDLRRVIKQVKPDLIHAGPLQRCAFLVALSGFQPLVSASWGYDLLQDVHRNSLWRWATIHTLKHSAVMIGDCSTIRQIAVSLGMPDERIITFPWGIDLNHFSPISKRAQSDESVSYLRETKPFTLLSTRSWEPIYGVDVIARAFILALRECPNLRLVLLGNGSQAAMLRQIFLKAGVLSDGECPKVISPGQVGYRDLPRFYHSADLYLSASHSDGTSISLLEAMACGCPVLVSDIPGNREWVTPDIQGWLFPDGDVEALASAILKAVDLRSRLTEMGLSARKLAEERADWGKNFQELLRAYELAVHHQR